MLASVFADLARRVLNRAARPRNGAAAPDATGPRAPALLAAGIAKARAGALDEARTLLESALREAPHDAAALETLANVEHLLGRDDVAEALYRRVLAVAPRRASCWANLGLCLRARGRIGEAEAAVRQSLALVPDAPESRLSLALIQVDGGALDAGESLLRSLIAEQPEFAEAHAALAHLLLLDGRYVEGWREYEWRLRLPEAHTREPLALPYWDGAPAPGKTLLITAEQGLGDQIMLLSCVAQAAARAGACWLECDARLAALARRAFPAVRVLDYRRRDDRDWLERTGAADLQVPMGSLPGLLRPAELDSRAHHGYLSADPARVQAWRERLAGYGAGRRIGLSWRGGLPATRAALRSLPLAAMVPLMARSADVFVSLQYGAHDAEIDAVNALPGVRILRLPEAIADYEETAALVASLDLVITVQTAVAHLAGALGRPVWIMLPMVPEWRYGARGERMRWYPSARLFRQVRSGDWAEPIDRVARALQDGARAQTDESTC